MQPQQPDLIRLIEDVSQLVSPPEVYYQLERALACEHTSLEDIARIIGTDPDLSARLLRLANSAFYGYPSKIESIARALSNIGTRQLRDLVLATVVVRLFSRLPFAKVSMRDFWRHAIHVGLIARALAQTLGEPNDARYYLVGLLHDIGRLVLYLKLPDEVNVLLQRAESDPRPMYLLEREHLGFDHAGVGEALLSAWSLPVSLTQAVGAHHAPDDAPDYFLEARVVAVADCISKRNLFVSSNSAARPEFDLALLAALGVQEAEAEAAGVQADAQLAETLREMGVK